MVMAVNNSSAQLRWADKFQGERRTLGIISRIKTIIEKLATISESEKKQVNTAMKKYEEMGLSLPIARLQ